eukprot:CAMPEP_0202838512 /NCGR_PEP_ID=MMETSP1389-20130828/49591_1 /ASSEMBLY_ACC=CAM_ASM_000865 /TAXON_ID=302021 /ORGANISM="Rhodomonas sp., Strain CCMP768" /LENGTH=52 /DNA_ID=CAMNT_0049514817 /DNA_START=83 /DNA_END=237 /DNA_ORIENTATION=+
MWEQQSKAHCAQAPSKFKSESEFRHESPPGRQSHTEAAGSSASSSSETRARP